MKRIQILVLVLLAVSLVLWSCGGGEKQTADQSAENSNIAPKDMTTPATEGEIGRAHV